MFAQRQLEKNGITLFMQDDLDPVTGGVNFTKFIKEAARLLQHNPKENYVIYYSDIKNFKYINDVYGFETGNRVLEAYYSFLSREHKLAYARMNADRFVSIEPYRNRSEIGERTEKRMAQVENLYMSNDGIPPFTVFVGGYCTDGDNLSIPIEAMVDRAILAHRQCRNSSKAKFILYEETFRQNMLAEQEMENRMLSALENGEFVVYLQPKFNIREDKIAAAEALVRWDDPVHGLISPGKFIPLFERNGFIKRLDTYMFGQICYLLRKWIDVGQEPIPVSVNVSKVQLTNPTFLQDYIDIKERCRIPDGLIEIEFTESMLFDNADKMTDVLTIFKAHGFRSSIDDFGAGYSSLNLLKDLKADILKLDRLFFIKNSYQEREKVIIQHVISMAKGLSMQTVAEGVEYQEQVDFLKSVECEMVQGFIYDKPLPVSEFEKKYIHMMEMAEADV